MLNMDMGMLHNAIAIAIKYCTYPYPHCLHIGVGVVEYISIVGTLDIGIAILSLGEEDGALCCISRIVHCRGLGSAASREINQAGKRAFWWFGGFVVYSARMSI
jgi:hypothetical protein